MNGQINFLEKQVKSEESASLFSLKTLLNGAVGPYKEYCDGYGNPGASGNGYINVLTLDIGVADKDMDPMLEGIVSFDCAEAQGTYIGQINMIVASSFCGLNGLIWGYHLAIADDIVNGKVVPLFMIRRDDGIEIPVYSAEPLIDAGQRLLGRNENRRFSLLPGAHVVCAKKNYTSPGPKYIWSALAICIAEDRQKNSNLFIEDAGELIAKDEKEVKEFSNKLLRNIAKCATRCGENQRALYKEIWISYRIKWIPDGKVGCALVAAPYLVLAQNAVPFGSSADKILNMSISEWEKSVNLKLL